MDDLQNDQGRGRNPPSGYRGRILGLALIAAGAPWSLLVWEAVGASSRSHPFVASVAAAVSILALFCLGRCLRPIARLAGILATPIDLEAAALLAPRRTDEAGTIMGGVAELAERVTGLHHRWIQRHPLTSLPTREYLLIEIAEDLECGPEEVLLGVVRFSDYDRLAAFDPSSAEAAIRSFADRLAAAAGKERPLAHIDRDRFAIWFRNTPDAASAAAELEAIRYALGAEIGAGSLTLMPDVSIGAAVYPRDGSDPADLVNRALLSMSNGDSVRSNARESASLVTKARERFTLEQDLRHAIDRDQFQLHFQPVIDIGKDRLVGAEALLRWHHPQAGMVPPSHFVPIAEASGLADEIGMWTLNAACREARRWQQEGLEGIKLAVNLSARQLRDLRLRDMIARTLERHRLAPQALEIELTETVATEDAERTLALFTELRAMGICLAIDDFGSGYSSLSYLKNLPFDKLKVDREFVVLVHERRDSQAICRSLIELARGLGLRLLAEGVEREEEVLLLRSFGCTLFQGFFFSRPLGADEFLQRARRADWQKIGGVEAQRDMIRKRIAG